MKKKFNFKGAVLGAALLAAGSFVSVPVLVPTATFAATESVESTNASNRVVVTRTIRFYYKNADGTVKPVKSTENKDFILTRSAVFQAGDTTSVVELDGCEVPAIAGYIPDKTYVESITVNSASKPEDVIVYYTANPAMQKTYETETKTISRNITFYRIDDDGKAVQTYHKKQSATFSRIITVYGDGRREEGKWQDYEFKGEEVPAMQGYTPSLQAVPTVTADPDNPPEDVSVYYKKNDQEVRGTYEDVSNFTVTFTDGAGKTLKTQTVKAGGSAVAPADPTRSGYVFAGWDKSFTNVRGNLTVNAKWTKNSTSYVTERKHVERKIYYYYADGSKVIDINNKHAVATQSADFVRYNIKDDLTGKITYSDWSAVTWDKMDVMQVPGYTPSISEIPAVTFTPDNVPKDIKVYYTKNGAVKPVTDTYTGVRYQDNAWRYVKNGKFDRSYTGVARSTTGNWVFVKNGIFDYTYTGVARSTTGNWVFVKNGRFNASYTGVARSTTGNWVYVLKGRYNDKATGVARSITGNFVYVRNGKFNTSFTGVAKSLTTGDWIYVKNGRYYTGFTGNAKTAEGRTMYVVKGRVR